MHNLEFEYKGISIQPRKSRKLFVLNIPKFEFFVGKGVTPRNEFVKYVEKLFERKGRENRNLDIEYRGRKR